MIGLVRRHIYFIIVILVSLLVAVSSYVPGTWLSGWDTLHPEFNFWVYLQRIFFGVWQSHQGLGALASQAHPAELPRMIILGPLIAILPDSLVRYSYFYLTLLAGPVGVYLLLKRSIFIDGSKRTREITASCGSLFYLLNLGTLQHFYVPFEMFATHFATIGFQFHFIIQFLRYRSRRDLFWLSLVIIFSTPMAHTATLWYANFFGIAIFLFTYLLLHRNRMVLKASGIIIGLTVILNLYWILPNAYFAVTKGQEVSSSKIHSLFTEEAFAQSASFGTLKDLALLKNFLFNWGEYVGNDRFGPLLDEWIAHLNQPFVTPIGYLLFLFVIVGIFVSLRRRDKTAIAFLPVMLLCVFFWLNINPPFGKIFSFLRESLPIFKEVFRFPFTKFSILLMCIFSMYFAWTVYLALTFLQQRKKTTSQIFVFIIVLAVLVYYMLPAFTGNMISRSMKVSIPKAYFSMFEWFNHQGDGRVATLPIQSFWGWVYHGWGYQGAGFLWFGIKQPLLDREFDRWSWYNEQYYREMSQAVYTKDLQAFKNVLTKYDISYIVFDKSIIAPGSESDPQILFHKEAKSLIANSDMFAEPVSFSEYLRVYPIRKKPARIKTVENPEEISQTKHPSLTDIPYQSSGTYVSSPSRKDNTYIFSDLVDNQNRISSSRVSITESGLQLSVPTRSVKAKSYADTEAYVVADLLVKKTGKTLQVLLYPLIPDREQKTIPISATLPLPASEEELIVSINDNDQFALSSLPNETLFSLGTVSLLTKNTNTISLYVKKPDKTMLPDFRVQDMYNLITCGQSFDQPVYGLDMQKNPNSFVLFGKASPLCLFMKLDTLLVDIPRGSLLSVHYSFTGDTPNMCLLEEKSSLCSQYRVKNFFLPSDLRDETAYFPLRKKISDLSLQFFLDTTYEKVLKRASYENISLGVHYPKAQVSIDPSFIIQALGQTSQTLSAEAKILIPFSGEKQLSYDLMLLPKTGSSCTQVIPRVQEQISKEFVRKTNQQYIRYYSQSGSFCDHFSYSTLPHSSAYVVIIRSRNQKGFPLRMCITNLKTKRCDVYTHLTTSEQFTSEIFFLPKSTVDPGEEAYGYDINLNNYAVSRSQSINDIASIQVVPFPDTWLQSITQDVSPKRENHERLVTLSESFEPGWHAYIIVHSKLGILNDIKTALPFLFGKKLNDHVVVNGWANGWVLSRPLTGNDQIVIFFVPQLLEYIGFICFLFLPLFFLRQKSPRRTAEGF